MFHSAYLDSVAPMDLVIRSSRRISRDRVQVQGWYWCRDIALIAELVIAELVIAELVTDPLDTDHGEQ